MTTVFVVESGNYEQRGIDLIAESVDAAVEGLKEQHENFYAAHPQYAAPVTQWSSVEHRAGMLSSGEIWEEWTIKETSRGSTTEHTITEWELTAVKVKA